MLWFRAAGVLKLFCEDKPSGWAVFLYGVEVHSKLRALHPQPRFYVAR